MKDRFEKLRIQWKIFAFMLLFSGILLVVLWLFQIVFLNDSYKMIRRREINKAIDYVSQNLDSADYGTLIKNVSANYDILIMPTKEFKLPDHIIISMEIVDRSGPGWIRGKSRGIAPEVIQKDKVFTLKNGDQMSLTFYAMITPVNATVAALRFQLHGITIIMISLSVALAYLIAKNVSKPIEEISRSAKKLAQGDYETEFHSKGYLEISELANTLNVAANELNKTESLRRELLANISHDLRTPLSLIYSYAEMMNDFPGEITSDQTQVIMDESKRLSSLVNDVFSISKFESGIQKLECEQFNLTQSIRESVERMGELVKKDSYQIDFQFQEEIVVEADPVKITQAFYNLLLNAINYSGADKRIIIRQTASFSDVKVEVIDHGEGIEEESFPYIWDRYYKVDKTHKRAVTGTGLGLSIVKKIIELHHGSYGVASEVGAGSTFWFSLKRV